ncbi:MAG TPA: hypothetical protein VKZ79_08560 [Alphaproteobacteria bacterium]|nr:hypothetical protein [Alphaproteobacteria bacterium]
MLTVPPVLTIEPTSYAPGSTPQQPNLTLGTGTITAGPDRIWDLVRPVTLDATQAYRDQASGQIAVQTPIGTILVQTADSSVPLGVPLSLKVTPGDPPLVTFLPSQGNAGGSDAARQDPIGENAPAVLVSDAVASSESLAPGQIITLTAIAQPGDQPPGVTLDAEFLPTLAQASPASAPLVIEQTYGAAVREGQPVPTLSTPAQPAAQQQPAPLSSPTPTTSQPGAIEPSLAQATLQAEAVAVSILSIAEGAAATPPLAGTPILEAPALPASGSVGSSANRSSDLTGLSSALAAQLPPDDPALLIAPGPTSGVGIPTEEEASISMRVLAVVPPDAPMPLVPPGAIVATVEGSTLAGQPILQSDGHNLVVDGRASIAAGTRIILDPIVSTSARGAALPPPLDPIAGHSWPALAAALPALASTHSALSEMMRLAIPQEGPLLGPVLLLFAASLRRSDVRGWLGDGPLNELQRAGHDDLVQALRSDFERASQQSSQALGDGWHTLPIPIFAEGMMSRVQLHLRRYKSSGDKDGSGQEGDQNDVRFIVEAEPSATGPVQLDGLVRRPRDAPAALDLIVRSQMPLAPEMRNDIMGLFSNSLAVTGLKGGIVFQGGMNWVKVARDRASASNVMA